MDWSRDRNVWHSAVAVVCLLTAGAAFAGTALPVPERPPPAAKRTVTDDYFGTRIAAVSYTHLTLPTIYSV